MILLLNQLDKYCINYNLLKLILLKGYPVPNIKLFKKLLINIYSKKWNHLLLSSFKIFLHKKEN
jgi:hypothetical protein